MAQSPPPENPTAENLTETQNDPAKKKVKTSTQQLLNPIQYRAVRFVTFMLEDTKYEISTTDFIREAIGRHLALYQTKRGIEFPNKMLAELSKLDLIPSTSRSEE